MLSSRPKKSQLHNDALWNVMGSLIYAGCQWGILVATVKLSSGADAGMLSLGFAICAPVFLLLQLRLRAASATDAKLSFAPAHYARLRALCTVIALVVCWMVCIAGNFSGESKRVVMWVAIAKAVESGSDLMYGLMQQAGNLRRIALSLTARGLLAGSVFTLLLGRTHRLDWALAGLCASWATVFLVIDLRFNRVTRPAYLGSDWKALWSLTSLTLPLGVSTMLMSLMANVPRYYIAHSLGPQDLGIFSATGYLTMTVSIIISAIAESSVARMARLFAANDRFGAALILRSVLFTTVVLSALSFTASLVFGGTILRIVYRSEYGPASTLLVVLMVASAMANMSSVYGYALLAARSFRRYLVSLAVSLISIVVSCALLIPKWGLMGAAVACVLGYSVQCAASFLLLRRDIEAKRKHVSFVHPIAQSAA